MIGGSQQLRLYRRARRDGATMMTACVASGIAMEEARLIEAEDAANPPPPEAFELLTVTPAAPAAQPEEDSTMARPKKQQHAIEEVGKPDYALAAKIYREDIRPAQSKMGEHGQEQSTAFKAIKKQAHIQPQAAKAVFNLVEMEEAKRDDFLRSFQGLLKEFKIGIREDLVDTAEGKHAGDVVPITSGRPRSGLATIPPAPPGDTDLNPDDDDAEAGEHEQAAE